MTKTGIQELTDRGQSVWIDIGSRPVIREGRLADLIDKGVSGLVWDPAGFARAIVDSPLYEPPAGDISPRAFYEQLVTTDIRAAADAFLPVFRMSKGRDGMVCLAIDPCAVASAPIAVQEGLRLARAVDRPNLMLGAPATAQGCRAIEELTMCGISVGAMSVFSVQQYMGAAQAYIRGIERSVRSQKDVRRIRSVAGIGVAGLDRAVDRMIAERLAARGGGDEAGALGPLRGTASLATGVLCRDISRRLFSAADFAALADQEAHEQRLLWASPDVLGPWFAEDTVTVMTETTLDAFMERGAAGAAALPADTDWARAILERLTRAGVDVDVIGERLLRENVREREESFSLVLDAIARKAEKVGV
jgi:transaldolase/glucose-6-phosphate isomerase